MLRSHSRSEVSWEVLARQSLHKQHCTGLGLTNQATNA